MGLKIALLIIATLACGSAALAGSRPHMARRRPPQRELLCRLLGVDGLVILIASYSESDPEPTLLSATPAMRMP
jgi:hypothetical protein